MPKFLIKSGPLAGFADSAANPGETFKVIAAASATSDGRDFHVWMKHITDVFLQPTGYPTVSIHRFLVVLHEDGVAEVYINDFDERAEVQVNKDVPAGAPIFVEDISDIKQVTFPSIEIKETDAVIYGLRTEWRFSLYFDLRRAAGGKKLSYALGEVVKEATFFKSVTAADARITEEQADAFVFTEGKSDWKHLIRAAESLGVREILSFAEEGYGADDLLKMCEQYSRLPHPKPIIFIFDRDNEAILGRLMAKVTRGLGYQEWGNNVFSLYLPIPPGRADETHSICIEFFYRDEDIIRPDEVGRRLYLSTEFNRYTGIDGSRRVVCRDLNAIKRATACIVDHGVFEIDGARSVALSKDAFATNIYEHHPLFKDVDHAKFESIFQIIGTIMR